MHAGRIPGAFRAGAAASGVTRAEARTPCAWEPFAALKRGWLLIALPLSLQRHKGAAFAGSSAPPKCRRLKGAPGCGMHPDRPVEDRFWKVFGKKENKEEHEHVAF